MEPPLDLYRASREDLLALIGHLREQTAELRREQARLTAELAAQRRTIAELTERVGTLLAVLDPSGGDDPAPHPPRMPGLDPLTECRALLTNPQL
jgi:hypothetical protein